MTGPSAFQHHLADPLQQGPRAGKFAELSATSYARSMSAFILGREKELQVLGGFIDSLGEGLAACVFEGEAGIGKTALWREGVARARAASVRVLSTERRR
jgi:hypothetical protein